MKWIWRLGLLSGILMILFVIGALLYVNRLDFTASKEETMHKLKSLSHDPRSEVVQFEGQLIHYVENGDPEKPVVLFVHGSPGDWDDFLRYMASPDLLEHVRLISVTRPGYGQSGEGRYEPSLQEQAAALLHVLDLRSPNSPAMLVGHSYGGPVVARMAMEAPERVAALILLSASVDPTLEKMKWYQYPAAVPPISWLIPPDLLVCNREILALERELEAMLPLWQHIQNPVTIIHGDQDELVPVANAEFAERMLVNAPLQMIRLPRLDHFIIWTHREIVIGSILNQVGPLNDGR